jgi:DNA topoisomerase I
MTTIEAPAPGLVFANDDDPGIRRRGRQRFTYVTDDGHAVREPKTLTRIRVLAVPPAWTDVWIAADPRAHVQATGRDARGRKQYRYHDDFRAHRDSAKFDDLVPFGHALAGLRRQVEADLGADGMSYERLVALVVWLLNDTYLRVGNESYARENGSFGLTTLRKRHVDIDGVRVRMRFVAKHGARADVSVADRRLARLIRRCQDLPGQLLFKYEDADGVLRPVRSSDVNDYLRVHTGTDATAKTFRVWGASAHTAAGLATLDPPASKRAVARELNAVIDDVARRLGNTRAVCRRSYVHPVIIDRYTKGVLAQMWAAGPNRPAQGLDVVERRLLHVLDG